MIVNGVNVTVNGFDSMSDREILSYIDYIQNDTEEELSALTISPAADGDVTLDYTHFILFLFIVKTFPKNKSRGKRQQCFFLHCSRLPRHLPGGRHTITTYGSFKKSKSLIGLSESTFTRTIV